MGRIVTNRRVGRWIKRACIFFPQVPVRITHVNYRLHALIGSDTSTHLAIVSTATYLWNVNIEHFLEGNFIVWLLIRVSLNCWDRDYRTVIASIKDRYESTVVLITARACLPVIYGECVVDRPHSVRFVRLYETGRVTSETHRGKNLLTKINKVVQGSECNLLYMSFI